MRLFAIWTVIAILGLGLLCGSVLVLMNLSNGIIP